jgi:hypothetical protein
MSSSKVGDKLWHITAIAETAPGREWLLKDYAIEVMKEIDGDGRKAVLSIDPIARYADSDAEQKFARALTNARKGPSTSFVQKKAAKRAAKKEDA